MAAVMKRMKRGSATSEEVEGTALYTVEGKANKKPDLYAKFDEATGFKKWRYATAIVFSEFMNDMGLHHAAAISHFTIMSVFPLIVSIAVIIGIFAQPTTRAELLDSFASIMPGPQYTGVDIPTLIKGFASSLERSGIIVAIFSLVLTFWSGTQVFEEFVKSANVIFKVKRDSRGFMSKMYLRLAGAMMVILTIVVLTMLEKIFYESKATGVAFVPKDHALFDVSRFLADSAIFCLMMIVLFRLSPHYKGMRWKPILFGAILTSVFAEVATLVFKLYFVSFHAIEGFYRDYGAAAGIIVFMLWIWVMACVVLLGLEVVALSHGVRRSSVDVDMSTLKAVKEAGVAADTPTVQASPT